MSKMFDKVLFLAGARKCATTSLFETLSSLDPIRPGRSKEPQFFALEPHIIENNLGWYRRFFGSNYGSSQTLLDGSTWYYGRPTAPRAISKYVEDPHVVIVIRDPAKRVYSSYLHAWRQTPRWDSRSLKEIARQIQRRAPSTIEEVKEIESALFERALANDEVIGNPWSVNTHKRKFGAQFPTQMREPFFDCKYFQESVYSDRVDAFRSHLGREAVSVVFFEDLISDPAGTIENVLRFADIQTSTLPETLKQENRTRVANGSISRRIMEWYANGVGSSIVVEAMKGVGFGEIGRWVRDEVLVRRPNKMGKGLYLSIRDLLLEEYAYWERHDSRVNDLWGYEGSSGTSTDQ